MEKSSFNVATFAYFSVTATSDTSNTTVTANTAKVGTFAMTSGTALNLGITAADMAKEISAGGSKDYWATTSSTTTTPAIVANHSDSEVYSSMSKVTLTGGDTGTKYHCTAQVKVSITGLADVKEQLQENDGLLNLKFVTSDESNVIANISTSASGGSETTETSLDLKDLANLEDGKIYYLTYDFTATNAVNSNGDTADLQASFKIVNRKDETREESENISGNQNYLAGKNITITIATVDETGNLKCDIAQS